MVVVVAITVYDSDPAVPHLDDAVVAVDNEQVDDTTEQDMVPMVRLLGVRVDEYKESLRVVFRFWCSKPKGFESISAAALNEIVGVHSVRCTGY